MGIYHTVEQGEHLSSIAIEYGFNNAQTIWWRQENAELRRKRENPNVLFPGDRVFIPDSELRYEPCATEQRHCFKIKGEALKLAVRLVDTVGAVVANTQCLVKIDSRFLSLQTDADGWIHTRISPSAEAATLKVDEREFELRIGHLDPADEVSGWRARLSNLGYEIGDVEEDSDPQILRWALEEFQCDRSLPLTGELDEFTKTKLKQIYGC